MARASTVQVVVEQGAKRVFASAVGWPGWCRSGRDEAAAIEALDSYAVRYSAVAERAEVRFPASFELSVVERVRGDASTDFGAPGAVADVDRQRSTPSIAARDAALVSASWATLDAVAASAPASLRKGPRGGGRDRDAVVEHVLAAEASYARKLGVRLRMPARTDAAAVTELHEAILDVLRRTSSGEPVVEKGWPPRYAARRIAWHVLDHAWEIQDRSL